LLTAERRRQAPEGAHGSHTGGAARLPTSALGLSLSTQTFSGLNNSGAALAGTKADELSRHCYRWNRQSVSTNSASVYRCKRFHGSTPPNVSQPFTTS